MPGIFVHGLQPRPPCLTCSDESLRARPPEFLRPTESYAARLSDGNGAAVNGGTLFGSFAQTLRRRQSEEIDDVIFARERAAREVQVFFRQTVKSCRREGCGRPAERGSRNHSREFNESAEDRILDQGKYPRRAGSATSATFGHTGGSGVDLSSAGIKRRLSAVRVGVISAWFDVVVEAAMNAAIILRVAITRPLVCEKEDGPAIAVELVENVLKAGCTNVLAEIFGQQHVELADMSAIRKASSIAFEPVRRSPLPLTQDEESTTDANVNLIARDFVANVVEACFLYAVLASNVQPTATAASPGTTETPGSGEPEIDGSPHRDASQEGQGEGISEMEAVRSRCPELVEDHARVTAATVATTPSAVGVAHVVPSPPRSSPPSFQVSYDSHTESDIRRHEEEGTACSSAIFSILDEGRAEASRNRLSPTTAATPATFRKADRRSSSGSKNTTRRAAAMVQHPPASFNSTGASRKRQRSEFCVRIINVPVPARQYGPHPCDPTGRMENRAEAKCRSLRQAWVGRPRSGIHAGVVGSHTLSKTPLTAVVLGDGTTESARSREAGEASPSVFAETCKRWCSSWLTEGGLDGGGGGVGGDGSVHSLVSLLTATGSVRSRGGGGGGGSIEGFCSSVKGVSRGERVHTSSHDGDFTKDAKRTVGKMPSRSPSRSPPRSPSRSPSRLRERGVRGLREGPSASANNNNNNTACPQPPNCWGRPHNSSRIRDSKRGDVEEGMGMTRMLYGVAIGRVAGRRTRAGRGREGDLSSVSTESSPVACHLPERRPEDGCGSSAEEQCRKTEGDGFGSDSVDGLHGGRFVECNSFGEDSSRTGLVGADSVGSLKMWRWEPPTRPMGAKMRSATSPREVLYRVLAAGRPARCDNQVRHGEVYAFSVGRICVSTSDKLLALLYGTAA